MKIAALIFLCLSGLSVSAQDIPNVDFCKLVKSPAAYDKKIVRTTAYYSSGYHGESLYNPRCLKDEDGYVNISGEESSLYKTADGIDGQIEKLIEPKSKFAPYVTVIGRFHDWNGVGHGYMNRSRFDFAVMAFTGVKAVKTPRVQDVEMSDFMSTVEHLRSISYDWNMTFMRKDRQDKYLDQAMADNYEFADSLGNTGGRTSFFLAPCGESPMMVIASPPIFFEGNKVTAAGEAIGFTCPLKIACEYRFEHGFERTGREWKLRSTRVTYGPVSLKPICP